MPLKWICMILASPLTCCTKLLLVLLLDYHLVVMFIQSPECLNSLPFGVKSICLPAVMPSVFNSSVCLYPQFHFGSFLPAHLFFSLVTPFLSVTGKNTDRWGLFAVPTCFLCKLQARIVSQNHWKHGEGLLNVSAQKWPYVWHKSREKDADPWPLPPFSQTLY